MRTRSISGLTTVVVALAALACGLRVDTDVVPVQRHGRHVYGVGEFRVCDWRAPNCVTTPYTFFVERVERSDGEWHASYHISRDAHHRLRRAVDDVFEDGGVSAAEARVAFATVMGHGHAAVPYVMTYLTSTALLPRTSVALFPTATKRSPIDWTERSTKGALAALIISRATGAESVVCRPLAETTFVPHWLWTAVDVESQEVHELMKEIAASAWGCRLCASEDVSQWVEDRSTEWLATWFSEQAMNGAKSDAECVPFTIRLPHGTPAHGE